VQTFTNAGYTTKLVKGKVECAPYGGALISQSQTLSQYMDRLRSLWHMASVMRGLRLPSQEQSVSASGPVPNYTAWWQRHNGTSVWTTWPQLLPGSRPAGSWTHELLIANPTPQPLSY